MAPKDLYLLFRVWGNEKKFELEHNWERTRQIIYWTINKDLKTPLTYAQFCKKALPFPWDKNDLIEKEDIVKNWTPEDWDKIENAMLNPISVEEITDARNIKGL